MTEAFDSERSTMDDEVRLLKDARLLTGMDTVALEVYTAVNASVRPMIMK